MTRSIPLQVAVSPETVNAAPDETVSVTLSVFNTSDIIDGFDITVIGADSEWVHTDPDWISLFPDTEGTVDVTLTLPADFPAGRHDLSLKVTSRTTHEVFAVSRVLLDVSDQRAAEMDLDPDARTGGRKGRFAVRMRNTGNVPVDVGLDADDDTGKGRYQLTPPRMILDPGEARTSQLVVTMPRPFTGIPTPKPFTVTATGTGVDLTVPGTYTAKPWIPRWLLMLLAVLGLMALWALIVGAALDAMMDDADGDIAAAFEEGIAAALGPGADGAAAADVVAGQAGTVPGTVTSSLDGTPVAGATVTALALFTDGSQAGQVDPERDPIEVASGDDGSFAFEEMIRGSYRVVASGTGYVTSEPATVEVPFEAEPVAILLTGQPGLIAGVTLNEGEPLESVTVAVRRLDPETGAAVDLNGTPSEEPVQSTATPANGRFSLVDLPSPATYEVEAAAPGYGTVRTSVDLAAGQQLIGLELEMVTAGVATVTGTVRHGVTGEPLGGVAVVATGEAGSFNSTTLTASAGLGGYTLQGVPAGAFTVTLTLEGFSDVALPLNLSALSPSAVLNASMFPAPTAPIGSVSGTVTDTGGSLVGGVTITVSGDGGTFTTASLTTNGQVGTYTASGIPAGTYTATFTLAGYATTARSVEITPQAPDVTVDATIAPLPGTLTGSLTGTVRDSATNSPLGGVTVVATSGGATYTITSLTGNGSAGSYTLDQIPLGTYTVSFTLSGYETAASAATIDSQTTPATLNATLTPLPGTQTGTITGTVRDRSTSVALGGVTVTASGGGETFTTTTLSNNGTAGTYTLDRIPLASYTLTFTRDNYETAAVSATISSEEPETTKDVTLLAVPTRVTGRVVGWQGEGGTHPIGPGIPISFAGTQVGVTDSASTFDVLVRAPAGQSVLEIGDGVTWYVVRPRLSIVPGQTTDLGDVYGFVMADATVTITDQLERTYTGNAQATLEAIDVFPFPEGLDLASLTRTGPVSQVFDFDDLPATASYTFRLTLPADPAIPQTFRGVLPAVSIFYFDHWTYEGAPPTEVHTWTPFYDGVVNGIIYCSTGSDPVPNAPISLGWQDPESTFPVTVVLETATTDSQGRFAFRRPYPVGTWPHTSLYIHLGLTGQGTMIGSIHNWEGNFPYRLDMFVCGD